MRWTRAALVGVLVGVGFAELRAEEARLAEPWWLGGDAGHLYEAELATSWVEGARGSLASSRRRVRGFGTIARDLDATALRGKRVRLRGELRAEGVRKWGGLWMRVDGRGRDAVLAFDNMEERGVSGSTPWRPVEVVLDVPPRAVNLALGFLLVGPGELEVGGGG